MTATNRADRIRVYRGRREDREVEHGETSDGERGGTTREVEHRETSDGERGGTTREVEHRETSKRGGSGTTRGHREADRAATAAMLDAAGDSGIPAVRVWAPGRSLAFGRRDARADGYARATAAAREHGFPPVERSVGGRAVAYADSTLAFAHAVPLDDARTGLNDRYEAALDTLVAALVDAGADVERGEPPRSYCPGDYSVMVAGGGKVAGIAQRVRDDAALVSGCVTVAERGPIRAVLGPVYDALGVPFDPDSVGSLAQAGGPADPAAVRDAIEGGLVDGREVEVCDVRDLPTNTE